MTFAIVLFLRPHGSVSDNIASIGQHVAVFLQSVAGRQWLVMRLRHLFGPTVKAGRAMVMFEMGAQPSIGNPIGEFRFVHVLVQLAPDRCFFRFAGAHAERIASGALLTLDAVRDALAGFESAGCDLFIMSPAVADPAQVELLAEAVRNR
jgi:hypothetical protein